MTLLRRLNLVGMDRLAGFLDSLKTETAQAVPVDILTHPTHPKMWAWRLTSNRARSVVGWRPRDTLTASCPTLACAISIDIGLSAVAGMFYFDELCPADQRGLCIS